MARELGCKDIHAAHLVIDPLVNTEWVRRIVAQREGKEALDDLDPNRFMPPACVAEAYWLLCQRPRESLTFELDVRPFDEKY